MHTHSLSLSHTHKHTQKRAGYQEKALTGHVLVKVRPTHLMATSSLGDPEPMLKFAAMGPVTSLGGLEPKPPSCVPVKEPRRPGLSKTQLSQTLCYAHSPTILCSLPFVLMQTLCYAHSPLILCSLPFVLTQTLCYANCQLILCFPPPPEKEEQSR